MILCEAKQVGTLYRTIDIKYLKDTLQGDMPTVDGVICMTRDKNYSSRTRPLGITLIINGDKLSDNYKVYPYMNPGEDKLKFHEAETRVTKPIKNFRRYLMGVMIPEEYKSDSSLHQISLERAGFSGVSELENFILKYTKNISYIRRK